MHESGTFYKRTIYRRNTLTSQGHLSLVFHSSNSTKRDRQTSGLFPTLFGNKTTSLFMTGLIFAFAFPIQLCYFIKMLCINAVKMCLKAHVLQNLCVPMINRCFLSWPTPPPLSLSLSLSLTDSMSPSYPDF